MTMSMNVVKRRMVMLGLVGVALVVAGDVALAAGAKRIGLPKFHGPAEGATRNAVARAAKANKLVVVGPQQLDKTAKKLGVKLRDEAAFTAVARELGIAAFVTGEVTKKKATLTVRSGGDGSVSAEATWTGASPRKLAGAVEKTFWRRLGSAIEHGKAPSGAKQAPVVEEPAAPEAPEAESSSEKPASAPASTAEAKGTSASEPPRKTSKPGAEDAEVASGKSQGAVAGGAGGPGLEGLDVAVGAGVLMRSLSYHDNPNGEPKYGLPLGPQVGVTADIFPAVLVGSDGFVNRLGLTLALNALVPGTVTTAPPSGPGNYSTRSLEWLVGVKVRVPAGFYLTGAYGDHAFGLNSTGGAVPSLVPTTDYRFIRGGVGGRWRLSNDFALMANLAYLQVLSFGAIGDANHFPRSRERVRCRLDGGLSPESTIRGARGRRHSALWSRVHVPATAPLPAHVAGGAIDQYVSLWAALAVVLDRWAMVPRAPRPVPMRRPPKRRSEVVSRYG